jgi:hypothetical protein
MDTHITAHPIIGQDSPLLSARLPGEAAGAPPDEGASNAVEAPAPADDEQLTRSGPSRPTQRRLLLIGVSILALGAAGVSAFLVSPYNRVYPVPQMASTVRQWAAQAGLTIPPPPLAPSASLAKVALSPPPPPVVRERFTPKPQDQQIQELLALHAGHPASEAAPQTVWEHGSDNRTGSNAGVSTAQSAAGNSAKTTDKVTPGSPISPGSEPRTSIDHADGQLRADTPPVGYVPHEPGSAANTGLTDDRQPALPSAASGPQLGGPSSPSPDLTEAVLASLRPSTTAPSSPAPGVAAPTQPARSPKQTGGQTAALTPTLPSTSAPPNGSVSPLDAATAARELRAAPMASHDEVQVLGVVTEMATMLRDVRTQDEQLREDFRKSSADTAARIADFERRLALAEARNAISAAQQAGKSPESQLAEPQAGNSAPATVRPTAVLLTAPQAALPGADIGSGKRYRVQAASPGLVLLAQVDRGGGDGAQIQVAVGDSIPGYGRVKSIGQRGTAWIVNTEHGDIQ